MKAWRCGEGHVALMLQYLADTSTRSSCRCEQWCGRASCRMKRFINALACQEASQCMSPMLQGMPQQLSMNRVGGKSDAEQEKGTCPPGVDVCPLCAVDERRLATAHRRIGVRAMCAALEHGRRLARLRLLIAADDLHLPLDHHVEVRHYVALGNQLHLRPCRHAGMAGTRVSAAALLWSLASQCMVFVEH